MNAVKKKIRIISDVVEAGGHKEPRYSLLDVEMVSTRRYHNTLLKLGRCSPCAILLMDYLTEQMNSDNLVRNDQKMRTAYGVFLKQGGIAPYSDKAIHKAVSELTEQELLLRLHKGTLRVNPLHYFRGDERRRPHLIRSSIGIQIPVKVKSKNR